ncbi:hypothetical protein Vadar_018090 [Vaccinium darrowii]|uniref:Uncharacterized protein n=1 Tax=Vaccinium darrowii TaxID=229202 RepID=A0ACB7XJG7_9ERIC|nr:hypothetical protein Vadar_018090 [Vaccinium darrowii]
MKDLRANPRLPITAFKERVRKELKNYYEELRRSNSGSTVVMDAPMDESVGQPRFNRLYIFLGSVKSRFLNGCRKIIGVDGCHLKGEYSGQILTAVFVDPNNAMYPMAWVVAEKEDKDIWGWFITLIKMDCGITDANEHEWTFINDKQKGLIPILNEMVPRQSIAFNRGILEARAKPIIVILEWIRCYLNNCMLIRREWIKKYGNKLLPNLYDRLENLIDESRTCYATWFGDLQFQCRHQQPEVFIHAYYSKASYLRAYEPLIKPINGYKMWPQTEYTPVLPPTQKRKVGRPRMKRIRALEEYINEKNPNKLRRVG